MKTQRILFVETQGRALDRMRTAFSGARPDWEVLLVVDAGAALELLARRPGAMVVASFGSDRAGCEAFFQTVRDRAPGVMRMGLLSDRHRDATETALDYAHQCLAAHCDATQVEAAIARGLSVWRRTRGNPWLVALMSDLQSLPTPPALYFDIRDELESSSGSARSVARIVARDPGITARLLQVANSGFYASPRTIADLYEALTLLGMDTVLALVLAARLFDQLPLPGLRMDALWVHSVTVATLAKEIAVQDGGDRAVASTCGIAGLLHDIGELVFLSNASESYFGMVRRAAGDERMLLKMEQERFGVGHPELGAHILALWGLPEEVVDAVAAHHGRDRQALPELPLPARAVYIAECLLHESQTQDRSEPGAGCAAGPSGAGGDGLERWTDLLERLAAQGLIQRHRTVGALFG